MDSLERRYRRLLVAYPSGYRQRRADEIVGTFLDLAAPGQTRPRLADAADLLSGGVRQRLGLDTDADLNAGAALAGPVALALAAGLSAFLWWSVEPLFGSPLGHAAPAAYAAWLLALAGWMALPARYARWPVALAMAVTALVLPLVVLPFLVLMNDEKFVKQHKNGPISNFVVFASIVLAFVIAVVAIPLEIFGGS